MACHALFFGAFAYMTGFVGNLLAPKTIDTTMEGAAGLAIAIHLLLLGLSSAQHSIIARPAFQRIWTRVMPAPIERSTYLLAACVATLVSM